QQMARRAEERLQIVERRSTRRVAHVERDELLPAGDCVRHRERHTRAVDRLAGAVERELGHVAEPRTVTGGDERLLHELRSAADGHEVGNQLVRAGARYGDLDIEGARSAQRWMYVREVLEVAADDEQVKDALVHLLEAAHDGVRPRIADDE